MNNSVPVGHTKVDELAAVQAVFYSILCMTKNLGQGPNAELFIHLMVIPDSRYWRYSSIYITQSSCPHVV